MITNSRLGFPLGLVVFGTGVALYKAISLSLEMGDSLAMVAPLLSLDLLFLGLFCLIATRYAFSSASWARVMLKTILLGLLVFYTIHSFVLLALDEYMSLFDFGRYLFEWRVVLSFFDALITGICIVGLLAVFLDYKLTRRTIKTVVYVSVLILVVGMVQVSKVPFQLQKYAVIQTGPLKSLFSSERGSQASVSSYTAEEFAFYSEAGPDPVEFMQGDPNVILLIVESLSSINSHKISGERDLLRQFDTLAEQGLLFRNFFANHSASEGGLISLLSGFPPLHYPGATPLMFDEFADQDSIIGAYRQHGYFTEFLTNTDLNFIGMNRYLSGLEFDLSRGRDEVKAMAEAPRFVQNAPSDRYLYDEALERVATLSSGSQSSWLMTVATVSTHLPYAHPEGGEDTPRAVWEWSLEQLNRFYAGLRAEGFFESGVLLIVGDHRQMRPLTRQETKRFGDSAKARIPLLVIGKEIPEGQIDDRFFQQSDLLRMLSRIPSPELELSPQPIWVERYNRIYGKVDSINRFGVFDQARGGMHESPVQIRGTSLSWNGERPDDSRTIEARIHEQRSRHQFVRSQGRQGCEFGEEPAGLPPEENLTGGSPVLQFQVDLQLEDTGLYWFRAVQGRQVCIWIDNQLVASQSLEGPSTQGSIELEAGLHALNLQYSSQGGADRPGLEWVRPGQERWRWAEVPFKGN
jgi:hypothetical protein